MPNGQVIEDAGWYVYTFGMWCYDESNQPEAFGDCICAALPEPADERCPEHGLDENGAPFDMDNGLELPQIRELERIGMDADNANIGKN